MDARLDIAEDMFGLNPECNRETGARAFLRVAILPLFQLAIATIHSSDGIPIHGDRCIQYAPVPRQPGGRRADDRRPVRRDLPIHCSRI